MNTSLDCVVVQSARVAAIPSFNAAAKQPMLELAHMRISIQQVAAIDQ